MAVWLGPVATAAGLAAWRKPSDEGPLEFDVATSKRLQSKHPEVVLMGNSMVHGRLNPEYLVQQMKPLTAAIVSDGATRSLQWFLWLKNQVVPSRPTPRVVFIFYRDYDFHNLRRSISGRLLTSIRQTMFPGDEEFLLRARAKDHQHGSSDSVRDWVDEHFKSLPLKEHVSKKISDNAYDVASMTGPLSDRRLKTHVEGVFGLSHLRTGAQPIAGEDTETDEGFRTVFNDTPSETLLQDFVRVADQYLGSYP